MNFQAFPLSRKLFLIDAIGAVVSSVFLGLVLPAIQEYIGLSVDILYKLTVPAVLFALYSLSCFLINWKNPAPWLVGIGLLNLGYVVYTAFFLLQNHSRVQPLGWAYFIGEIIIVVALALVELRQGLKK